MALTKPTRVEIPGKSRYVIQINSLMSFLPTKTTGGRCLNGPLEDETHLQQKSIFRFYVQSRVIPGNSQ